MEGNEFLVEEIDESCALPGVWMVVIVVGVLVMRMEKRLLENVLWRMRGYDWKSLQSRTYVLMSFIRMCNPYCGQGPQVLSASIVFNIIS